MKVDPILVKSLQLIVAGVGIMLVGVIVETPVLVAEVVSDVAKKVFPFSAEKR